MTAAAPPGAVEPNHTIASANGLEPLQRHGPIIVRSQGTIAGEGPGEDRVQVAMMPFPLMNALNTERARSVVGFALDEVAGASRIVAACASALRRADASADALVL